MKKGFLLTQINYKWNDNEKIYSPSGETPIKFYGNKVKAKQALDELNLEALVFSKLAYYADNLHYIIKDFKEFEEIILKYTINFDNPIDFTDRQWFSGWFSLAAQYFKAKDKQKLLELVNVKFYNITEVEIDNEDS